MAINYSYPIGNPAAGDTLIGSKNMGEEGMITKSFTIGDILALGNGATGPQGPVGPQGPPGTAWQGEWITDNDYIVNDAVSYGGSSYICVSPVEGSDTPPDSDPANWDLLAEKGDTGPGGPQLEQIPFSVKVNNTGTTATPTAVPFRSFYLAPYTGAITFSDGQTPTGTINASYNWQVVGTLITINISVEFVSYTVTTGESVRFELLGGIPTPVVPTGFSGSNRVLYVGVGGAYQTETSILVDNDDFNISLLRANGSSEPVGYHFLIPYNISGGKAFKVFRMTLQYFTA